MVAFKIKSLAVLALGVQAHVENGLAETCDDGSCLPVEEEMSFIQTKADSPDWCSLTDHAWIDQDPAPFSSWDDWCEGNCEINAGWINAACVNGEELQRCKRCHACDAGQEPTADHTACTACDAGSVSTGEQCTACGVGQGPNTDHTACVSCSDNEISTETGCKAFTYVVTVGNWQFYHEFEDPSAPFWTDQEVGTARVRCCTNEGEATAATENIDNWCMTPNRPYDWYKSHNDNGGAKKCPASAVGRLQMSKENAYAFCANIGRRLCTLGELHSNFKQVERFVDGLGGNGGNGGRATYTVDAEVCAMTGCGTDSKPVWALQLQ